MGEGPEPGSAEGLGVCTQMVTLLLKQHISFVPLSLPHELTTAHRPISIHSYTVATNGSSPKYGLIKLPVVQQVDIFGTVRSQGSYREFKTDLETTDPNTCDSC